MPAELTFAALRHTQPPAAVASCLQETGPDACAKEGGSARTATLAVLLSGRPRHERSRANCAGPFSLRSPLLT